MSVNKPETVRQPYTRVSLILDFLRGSIKYFVISILSALCVTGLDMLSPQLIRTTVDGILGDNELKLPEFLMNRIASVGGVGYLRDRLWLIGGLLVIMALFSVAFRYLFMLFNARGAESLVETMRNRLFSHIQRLPFSWHMQNQTGDIIQRCTSDVDMVKNFVSEQLTSVFRIVILIILSLFFMFSMNPRLTLVALASIPIIIAYSAYFHSKIGRQFMICDENEGILSTIAQENLTGVRVVRAFGREKYEKDRFEKQNNIYTNLWIKLCGFMALFWGAGDLISGLQVMLIVILGAVFCVRGSMTAGEFIAFISYNAMLTWPVRSLGRMISEMSKAGVSIERIRYIMNSDAEQDKPEAELAGEGTPEMRGDIEFHNVSFSYGDAPILSDISFKIPQGTTFGILGGTGSGKSTLMHLLNRLYDLPKENGRITIGGVDIADMKGSWVRSHIGMVLQESFLFSRTIAENIGITRRGMSLSDIRWAASIACVDEAISEFSKGYDTVVGERGVTLSGGQKQRTAIARMLTQRTPIMVFDDSLSAVDSETDAKIRQALKRNLGDSTVILISHRVTTLMQAECILVLDKGRVAELGSHEELIKKKDGIYRRIYDMQMTLPEEVAEYGA
ncbi:MAG: ABC transporter ATP-binding protein [Lachnospiraceae bacterium]|nr:ABC transporter ATP-binding protein [Lachnospiraceae bacterium]